MCPRYAPPTPTILSALVIGFLTTSGAASLGLGADQAHPGEVLCPRFTLHGSPKPDLTETERQLICGGEGAWKSIPYTQAKFNFENFLQERGYHFPRFEPTGPDTYAVYLGAPTRVTTFTAPGAPTALQIERKREVIGELLTPKLLSNVEQWIERNLQSMGYPCPKIAAEGDSTTGQIIARTDPGPEQSFAAVEENDIPGAEPHILRRYDAFQLGRPFNGDLLRITEDRISVLKPFQNIYFLSRCTPDGAVIKQEVTVGPPRYTSVGFGFNTEGLVVGRASWQNSRIGRKLSLLEVTLQASTREQKLTAFGNWYHLPARSRIFWQPSFEVRHQNEKAFNTLSLTGKWLARTTWDNEWLGIAGGIGPNVEFTRTLEGSGEDHPNLTFTSLELTGQLKSHEFEYWATDPRTGYSFSSSLLLNHKGFLSPTTAQRLQVEGQALWNLYNYDPPLWVFGLRGGYSLTVSDERPGEDTLLPASYFGYLGGSENLRGFDRKSTPSGGAMTTAFLSPEARLASVLPWGLEPIVFMDFGLFGTIPGALDSELHYSPGFGLRFNSPIGVFRTTLAKGFPVGDSGGWTFYLSFGEEF